MDNILSFLTLKNEVAYIEENYTLAETLEKMEKYRYSSIPILTKNGKYVGTITEGDLLWTLRDIITKGEKSIEEIGQMKVVEIPRRKDNLPVSISANMDQLISKAVSQNFIPVVDDSNTFIGMVKRRKIIEYSYIKSTVSSNYIKSNIVGNYMNK